MKIKWQLQKQIGSKCPRPHGTRANRIKVSHVRCSTSSLPVSGAVTCQGNTPQTEKKMWNIWWNDKVWRQEMFVWTDASRSAASERKLGLLWAELAHAGSGRGSHISVNSSSVYSRCVLDDNEASLKRCSMRMKRVGVAWVFTAASEDAASWASAHQICCFWAANSQTQIFKRRPLHNNWVSGSWWSEEGQKGVKEAMEAKKQKQS